MTAPINPTDDREFIESDWCGHGYSDPGWDESEALSQPDWDDRVSDWAHLDADMAVPSALAHVDHWLGSLPLAETVTESLMSVISCAVAHAASDVVTEQGLSDGQLLDAAAGARVLAGFADSVVVDAAGSLAARAGTELLGRKGVADPSELTVSGRARWRARTKSLVAAELSTLTGWGVQECHTRVGVALAPAAGVGAARMALAQGSTDWRSVSAFWQKCRAMEVEDAGSVDQAAFGPLLAGRDDDDADGGGADSESTTIDVARESWPSFNRRLCREVVRVEGADEVAARARRRAARDRRGVRGEICDDGLGSFTVTGPTTSVVAALDRVETVSRRARKAGDPRPLDHIRSDTAMALLVHGTLPLSSQAKGGPANQGEDSRAESSGDSRDSHSHSRDGGGFDYSTARRGSGDVNSGDADSSDVGSSDVDSSDVGGGDACSRHGNGAPPEDSLVPYSDDVQRIISGTPAASVDVIVPLSVMTNRSYTGTPQAGGEAAGPQSASSRLEGDVECVPGVAEIPGHGFLTPGHAWEVMAAPWTVIHRLLTDPADGRLVERSTAAYRPDRSMVDQVRATDLFCRAPGCFTPAVRCELDHETPYGTPGGVTSEMNLNLKHPRHHQFKTEKFWTTVMDETRNLTWTTLFKKVYRTRVHDYRQYGDVPNAHASEITRASTHPEDSRIGTPDNSGSWGRVDRAPQPELIDASSVEDPDLRDRLIYAALCDRSGRDTWLEAVDDYANHPDGDVDGPPLAVFHQAPHQRRQGPPLGQSRPETLLAPPVEEQPVASEPPPPF